MASDGDPLGGFSSSQSPFEGQRKQDDYPTRLAGQGTLNMWVLLVSGRASHVQCYYGVLFLSWTPDSTSQGWRLTLRQPVLPCLLRVSTSLPACPVECTGDLVCHVPRNRPFPCGCMLHLLLCEWCDWSLGLCPRRSGRCLVPWKLAGRRAVWPSGWHVSTGRSSVAARRPAAVRSD